jgi:hypothetical protein
MVVFSPINHSVCSGASQQQISFAKTPKDSAAATGGDANVVRRRRNNPMALCKAMHCNTGSCTNILPALEVSRNLDNTATKRRYYLTMVHRGRICL